MKSRRIPILLCLLLCLSLAAAPFAAADLVNIGGKLRYYDEYGREAEQIGLDLSQFNNQIDFSALRDQGFTFVIIRLGGRGWGGSGRLYGDRETQANLHLAREAGLEVGAYFYSTAVNPAEALEEADAALKTLDGFPLDLPVYIDMEYSGDYPNGRCYTVENRLPAHIHSYSVWQQTDSTYAGGVDGAFDLNIILPS